MPFWAKAKGKVNPTKPSFPMSVSNSMSSLSPSQLNTAIMEMLNVNSTGNTCQNACRGMYMYIVFWFGSTKLVKQIGDIL